MWVGVTLLAGSLFGAAFDGLIVGVLTPTQKSPDRPGDQEARRFTKQSMKIELVLAGLGAAFLMTGIAIFVTV